MPRQAGRATFPGFAIRRLTATQPATRPKFLLATLSLPASSLPSPTFQTYDIQNNAITLRLFKQTAANSAIPQPRAPAEGFPWVHSHRLLPQPQATFRQDNGCEFTVDSFAHLNVCRHLVKCPWAKLQRTIRPR